MLLRLNTAVGNKNCSECHFETTDHRGKTYCHFLENWQTQNKKTIFVFRGGPWFANGIQYSFCYQLSTDRWVLRITSTGPKATI